MNKLFTIAVLLVLQACKSTTVFETSPSKTNVVSCEKIGEAVAPMAALKWANRNNANHDDFTKEAPNWKILSLVNRERFKNIGYSEDETDAVALQVFNTDISDEMTYDVLSYRHLYEVQCELEKDNVTPLPLADTAEMLNRCWFPVHNKGTDPDVCFKAVLSGKLTL